MPLNYQFKHNSKTGEDIIETSHTGKTILTTPQLNKGTAFSKEEREIFGLLGKLPEHIETLEQQTLRAYLQFKAYISDLQRHIFLNNLHDSNQILFYNLVSEHIEEMMPLIYTPHIATAVKNFSLQFRQPRGLYLSFNDRKNIDKILENRSNPDIDLIVVTDGESVLGIGDQGVGSINIPIAKLMVYTLCGGINPNKTLPIVLDVGTNNRTLLTDPLYLGWRNKRIDGDEYTQFINDFITSVAKHFPKVFLHWEDFAAKHSHNNLKLCKNKISSFNDDMQGTGAVVSAVILAAVKTMKANIHEQKFMIFGAGSAGTGIAEQIYELLIRNNIPKEKAKEQITLIDRAGIVTDTCAITPMQSFFAKDANLCKKWPRNKDGIIGLLESIEKIQPTILIGCSSVGGAFTEEIIKAMCKHNQHPLIMPLSNPTENAECTPADVYQWTNGKALVATGSPFAPIEWNGQTIRIAQCNNAFIFPGIGLGVIAAKASAVSEDMLYAASQALAANSPIHSDLSQPLLPKITESKSFAKKVAIAVAKQAINEGLSEIALEDIEKEIDNNMWQPKYCKLVKI